MEPKECSSGEAFSGKIWDSTINVCPGSSPTIAFSNLSVNEETTSDIKKETKPIKNTPSEKFEKLVDWGTDSPWPDLYIPGTWGTHGLEENPWDDKRQPYIKFRKYQELKLNEVESNGILTDRIIAACSSYLSKSPETGKYVLCKINLSQKHLSDIRIIKYHHYLQYVDFSRNELTNVEALGQLPFLMYLNLSHNLLTKLLGFKPPFNLTYVNYSHNSIQKIDDISEFWSIVHLDLSHNGIGVIEGLQELRYLRHLNLSHNYIECIENLNNMRLLTLDLQRNSIRTYEDGENVGFKTLIDILRVNLAYNHMKTLKLFEGISGIQSINIMENCIEDLIELTHLSQLHFLTEVDFRGNPIVNMKYYFEVCLSNIRHIYVLDGEIIDAAKKVSAKNNTNPSPPMHAIRKSSKIFFLQQVNDPYLGPSIVPIDQAPPPIIILVGPPGSNKSRLLQLFYKQHHRFIILGVSHTTRRKNEQEIEGESYYFIDGLQFRTMMRQGKFLTVSQTLGQYFGLAQSEISKTVTRSAALVLHMNLSGALTLRSSGLQCHLVLAMPSTDNIHRQWIFEKYYNWHDSSRFIGAVEVENCPLQAQRFLSECRKNSQAEIQTMSEDILYSLVQRATQIVDEIDDQASKDKESSNLDANSGNGSLSSIKTSANSSRTSGILKSPASRNKTADASHHRISVTFETANELTNSDGLHAPTHIQSSRSVTFGDVLKAEESEIHLTKYSISGTMVPEDGHDSSTMLSVISQPKRDSTDVYGITWDVQTEALKTATEEIISTREAYLDIHYTNPGLFTEVIFTDDIPESLSKLKDLLKRCIEAQPRAKPTYELHKDDVYHRMVQSRLKLLHNDIESELSITQKQLKAMDQSQTTINTGKMLKRTEKEKHPKFDFE